MSVAGYENERHLFVGTDHRYKFCLWAVGGQGPAAEFVFFCRSPEQAHDKQRRFLLDPGDFALLNPNTRTCPIFRTAADAELTRAIYRRVPVLVDEARGANAWGLRFLTMFHMSGDSHLFRETPGQGRVPLYEAKLFDQFDHRFSTYSGATQEQLNVGILPRLAASSKENPAFAVEPRYWVDAGEVDARLAGRWEHGWLLAFRDITNAGNERTAIFAILPRVAVGHTGPLVLPGSANSTLVACLLACFSSLTLDYVARQKVAGTHLTYSYLSQFPVLPPQTYSAADLDFVTARVLELTYTAWDLKPFAEDLGCAGPPFRWDDERRAVLRAELDAHYAALYGLTRDELRYVLDPQDIYGPDFPSETFRVLKERETRQYGEYRTQRLVLEAWDRLRLEPRHQESRYSAAATLAASRGPE